jgi:hypothetical protein
MSTAVDTLVRLRRNVRDAAEAGLASRLSALRRAEEALERVARRVEAHRSQRAGMAGGRLNRLAGGGSLGEAATAARCEGRLQAEEGLLRFGRGLAEEERQRCLASRERAAQALRAAEVRLAVVEQLLARQVDDERRRRLRRQEREADDYSSSRNSSL